MRTKILLYILIIAVGFDCHSQDLASSQIGNPNVIPPDVSSFQKVNFLPVSNYTGRANVDIPIFNIDLGGLSIPIGLSYNTGGVKPNDVSSSVGLNWSLNAGGMISKNVSGIDDFYNDYLHQLPDAQSGVEELYYEKRIGFLSYNANHTTLSTFPETDDLPDTFVVNAPGMSFSYIHNRGKIDIDPNNWANPDRPFTLNKIDGANQNGQYVNLEDTTTPWDLAPFILDGSNDYKINETYGNINLGMFGLEMTSFGGGFYNRFWLDNNGSFNPDYYRVGINSISIKSMQGYEYIFDKIDSSQYVLNRDENVTNRTVTYPDWLGTVSVNYSTNVNLVSYRLSKIIDLKTNKFVEFQYETYTQSFSEIIDNNVLKINHGDGCGPYGTICAGPKGLWQKYPKLNRLKKIIFDKGSVEFGYGLNRMDVINEKALTDITVYDKNNNQIKKVILNFDYFQTPIQQSSPFSKRLKLNEVLIQGSNSTMSEKYKLTYNTTPLPLRVMAVTDMFGYHNGAANNFQFNLVNNQYVTNPPFVDVIPNPTVFFHPNKGQFSFLPEAISSNAIISLGNYSATPNLTYCKAGILERIDYPTGGYTSFDYELNTFKINGYELHGGGLRIKEQKISDGTTLRTLKFEYLKEDGTSSGAIASMPKFVDFDYNVNNNAPTQNTISNNITASQFNSWFSLIKNNYPKSNIELTSGAYVGYSRVKVFEQGKGYTLYEYTNPESHPNTQADVIWHAFTNTPSYTTFPVFGKVLYDNGKLDFALNNDVFRGKLLKKSVFDQQNTPLKSTIYNYTEKLFKSMLAIRTLGNIYQNYTWAPASPFDTAPEPPYQYGYYKQRRYLLTNVIDNEYFNGQIVTKNKTVEYDDNYTLIKTEHQSDNLNSYRNEYYYPYDSVNSNELGMSALIGSNRIGERILSYNFKNNEKLLEEKTLYNSFNGLLLPKQVKKFKSGSLNNTNEIYSQEITLRDNLGNVCEVMDKNGNRTSYIWGYNNTVIVAKIENASYSSIPASLLSLIQSYSNTGTETQLFNALTNLRNVMGSSFVTAYTYKPLIGVSTTTEPNGDVSKFEYDAMGRLKIVRDRDDKILSENEYHYKPQN